MSEKVLSIPWMHAFWQIYPAGPFVPLLNHLPHEGRYCKQSSGNVNKGEMSSREPKPDGHKRRRAWGNNRTAPVTHRSGRNTFFVP